VSLCTPQISHGLTWDRTLDSAVRGRRLTAWALARPSSSFPWYSTLPAIYSTKKNLKFHLG
jgi:hypothetical protein